MLIELSKILTQEGGTLERVLMPELQSIQVKGESYRLTFDAPCEFRFTHKKRGNVLIHATAKLHVHIPCSRCLKDVSYPFSLDFEREVDTTLSLEERENAEEEYFFMQGDSVDIDKLLLSELLIHWPIRVLCKDDCKGICSRCGADLNIGECGCNREALDPRMAAINDIFSKFKEV